MIRRLLAIAAIALVATACFGAAATLAVTSDRVSAGSTSTLIDCETTAVTYTYASGDVDSVQVGSFPAGCHGGRIWLSLLNGAGAQVSQGTLPFAPGASFTVDVTNVDAALVKHYRIAVVK